MTQLGARPDAGPAPVEVEFGPLDPQRRWTVALRLLLALPHLFFAALFSFAAYGLVVLGWVAALALAASALDTFGPSVAGADLPTSARADAAQVEAKAHAMSLLFTAAAQASTASSYTAAATQLTTAGYDVDAAFAALLADLR